MQNKMSRGTHDCVDREIANAKPFQFRDSPKRYISVHHQSNRPLTGSETHETKTMQFPINEITIKVPICKKICDKTHKSLQFLQISGLFPIYLLRLISIVYVNKHVDMAVLKCCHCILVKCSQ